VRRFRGGLVFRAHILLYLSTLGLRVMKKKTTCTIHTPNTLFSKSRNEKHYTARSY